MKSIVVLLLSCSVTFSATLSFTWLPSDPPAPKYNLYSVNGSVTNLTTSVSVTNATISVAEAQWAFYVTAVYPDQESLPSNILPVSVQNPPAPQWTGVNVKKSGRDYDVTLTWDEIPASFYPTNYTVAIAKGATVRSISVSGSSSRVTFNNVAGGNYNSTIFASNMVGKGTNSSIQQFFVPGKPGELMLKQ